MLSRLRLVRPEARTSLLAFMSPQRKIVANAVDCVFIAGTHVTLVASPLMAAASESPLKKTGYRRPTETAFPQSYKFVHRCRRSVINASLSTPIESVSVVLAECPKYQSVFISFTVSGTAAVGKHGTLPIFRFRIQVTVSTRLTIAQYG